MDDWHVWTAAWAAPVAGPAGPAGWMTGWDPTASVTCQDLDGRSIHSLREAEEVGENHQKSSKKHQKSYRFIQSQLKSKWNQLKIGRKLDQNFFGRKSDVRKICRYGAVGVGIIPDSLATIRYLEAQTMILEGCWNEEKQPTQTTIKNQWCA